MTTIGVRGVSGGNESSNDLLGLTFSTINHGNSDPSPARPVAIPTRKSARRQSEVASASSSLSSSFTGGGVEKRRGSGTAASLSAAGQGGGKSVGLMTRGSSRAAQKIQPFDPRRVDSPPPSLSRHLSSPAYPSSSLPTHLASSLPTSGAYVPRSADDDGEIGEDELDGLVNPKGGKRRSSSVFRCETCAKVYRHPSCLVKHRWQHTPHWQESSKLSMSKHQQVQVLEAASILFTLAPEAGTSLPVDKSLWPAAVSPLPLPRPSISYQDSRLVSKMHSTHPSRQHRQPPTNSPAYTSTSLTPLPLASPTSTSVSSDSDSDPLEMDLDSGYAPSAFSTSSPKPPAGGSMLSPLAGSLGLPETGRRASFTSQMGRMALGAGARSFSSGSWEAGAYGSSPGIGVSSLRDGRGDKGGREEDDEEDEDGLENMEL